MTQHSSLTPERWKRFDLDRQILMVGNEMNRGMRLVDAEETASLRACYERVLRLTDLTVAVSHRRALRRELLRWRDLVAALYVRTGIEGTVDGDAHRAAFRALLQLRPAAARQIALLMR